MSLHDLHRPLGNTGLIVSPLGLGTVKLGRDQGVKYPNGFTIPDDAAARALLDQARALGINLIDTAPAYGVSEQRLGPLLRGQREDWVIVSKVGEEFENGQSRFDFSPAHTRLSVERSLQRLETDRIDLVLVHSDGNDLAILQSSGVYETLAELKREGKLRAFGLSGKTVEGGLLALERGDCAMVTYNLAEQGSLLVGWPTKLALSPDFADRVIAALERDGIQPGTHAPLPELPRPPQAQPVWEELLP